MIEPRDTECNRIRRAWHTALDDGRKDAVVEAHVESCRGCHEYVSEMTALLGVLDRARRHSETAGNDGAGRPRREAWVFRATRRRGALRWAAAVALLAGGGYAGWRTSWFSDTAQVVRMEDARPGDGPERNADEPEPETWPQVVNDVAPAPQAEPKQRPATDVTPIGKNADRYIIVASELPGHPQVKLYWVYESVTYSEPASTQGSS